MSDLEEDVCLDCHSTRFVESHGDLTCMGCGLVKYERLMIDEPEFGTYYDDTSSTFTTNTRLARFNNSIQKYDHLSSLTDTFEYVHRVIHVPECVIEESKRLLQHVFSSTSFKGDLRREMLVVAAVYFCSKQFVFDNLCYHFVFPKPQFNKMCTAIADACIGSEFEKLTSTGTRAMDTITVLVSNVQAIPSDKTFTIKKTVMALYDRTKHDAFIQTLVPDKLNATLVYMACRICKIPITLKQIESDCKTSMTTLINIEKHVKGLLRANVL